MNIEFSRPELSSNEARIPLLLAGVWVAAVWLLDFWTPLGFAHGVLYAPAVLLAVWTQRRRLIWSVAGVAMLLTLLMVPFSPQPPPGISMTVVWANRGLALVLLLLMASLGQAMLWSFERWRRLKQAETQRANAAQDAARDVLAQSLARWQALAEAMPLAVWTADTRGRLLFVSKAFSEYTGAPSAQLLGEGWVSFVHPEDQEHALMRWRQALRAESQYESEYRMRRHDGTYRWFFSRGRFVADVEEGEGRWYGSALDVHDRRELEAQSQDLAQRLTSTMASVTDAILLLDLEWRVTYINPPGLAWLAKPLAEVTDRDLWSVAPGLRGTPFEHAYRQTMQDGQARRVEAWLNEPHQRVEAQVSRFDDGLAIYFRDVTAQRALAEQLQRGQRLEALGQLTGGVAHDFNNLLTVILGNADMLRERHPAGSLERNLIDMISQAGQRGSDLTQRLLAFARKQALAPSVVDINRLLGDMDALLRRALGESIEVELVRAAGLWRTQIDTGQLENAVLNLAFNARDAMPQGGRLTLETANTRLDDAYVAQHDDLRPGQYVMLAVSDSGSGMSQAILARVFEPFFTTKEKGKGTGLGLPMVYGFAKQSGGHIAIYSEEGRGTTVKMYFPRWHQEAEPIDKPERYIEPHEPAQNGTQVILLVEDDAMVRQYARAQLQGLGYRVLEAPDGPAAIEILRSDAEINLLFTDIVMPGGMSGKQLADAAQALRPGLPVLYTSGYTDNAIVHHGRLDPGVMLLSKPYRRGDLARKVKAALAQTSEVTMNPEATPAQLPPGAV